MNVPQQVQASKAATSQQKRLQARRQPSKTKAADVKPKKQSSLAHRPDETKLVRNGFDGGYTQYQGHQEQFHVRSNQSSTTNQNPRLTKNQVLVSGSSFTSLGAKSKRVVDATESKKSLVSHQDPAGSLPKQEGPVQKLSTNQNKRQARTTHHSRQISWNRDQTSDLTHSTAKVSFTQHIFKSNDESQGSSQQTVTAAQIANQSQKSKMTQNILKRLKESIDRGHQGSSQAPSILPSQISDAYLTTQSKQRAANYQSAIVHGQQRSNTRSKKQANAALTTILEQEKNKKLVKSFVSATSAGAYQKRSMRTSSTVHQKAPQNFQSQDFTSVKKSKTRENSYGGSNALRESASPQVSKDTHLIQSLNANMAADLLNQLTKQISQRKDSANNPQLTKKIDSAQQINPPGVQAPQQVTKVITQGQFERARAKDYITVKKSQINSMHESGVTKSIKGPISKTTPHAIELLKQFVKAQQASKKTQVNRPGSSRQGENLGVAILESGTQLSSDAAGQKNAKPNVSRQIQLGATKKTHKTVIPTSQMLPQSSAIAGQTNSNKFVVSASTANQDSRLGRKAQTTHARTPASYRSISGGNHQNNLVGNQCEPLMGSPEPLKTKVVSKVKGFQAVRQADLPLTQKQKGKQQQQSLASKTRQNKIDWAQSAYAQQQPMPTVINAPSFHSLQQKSLLAKNSASGKSTDSFSGKVQLIKGSHKRSTSYKLDKQTASLLQSGHPEQLLQGVPQGMSQPLSLAKVKFSVNYEGIKQTGGLVAKQQQQKIVSPLRTKQPSINHSRRISKERDPSRHSQNSVTSPRLHKFVKAESVRKSFQANSFLSKANSKSFNNSSSLINSTKDNKEVQKLLKNFIKKIEKGHGSKHAGDAANSALASISSKSKYERISHNKQIKKLLENSSGYNDDDTIQGVHSIAGSTFHNQRTKDQQTFQETRAGDLVGPVGSSQNGEEGFSQVMTGSQKQICSAFNGSDIISGTYIATGGKEQIKVYPEKVKENLFGNIPTRTRISRVPTHKQLQSNLFENQVTLKRGDQHDEEIAQEQISILDPSECDAETVQSRAKDAVLFQAFNEYIQSSENPPQASGSAEILSPKQQRVKGKAEMANVRDFSGEAAAINFHPQQQKHPLNESPSPNKKIHSLIDNSVEQKMRMHSQGNPNREQQWEDEESSEYDSEFAETEVYDPLLEDKQYLVTMIVTHFQDLQTSMPTTHEFYRIGNKLGEGAFGKVCIAQHKLSGHFTAVKCMWKRDLNKEIECKKKIAQDIHILQHLTNHKNVVKLYDSFELKSHLCFVMELCAGGDLLSFVRRRKKLDETTAKYLFKQVAKGLAYCHRNLVLHRDIKLENLLLDEEGIVKICDFGVSQLLSDANDLVKDQCGTPAYMAPEVFECSVPFSGQKTDVWSLGVCLYAMVCGCVPFKGRGINELKQAIVQERVSFPGELKDKLSKDVKNLIRRMLIKDPEKRASIEKVLRHPWLRDCPQKIKIFSQSELTKIKVLSQPASGSAPQRLLTEVELTHRSLTQSEMVKKQNQGSSHSLDYGHKLENITGRSVVLAPFNSTITQESFDEYFLKDVPIAGSGKIKFSDRVRESNRQYEFNYNGEVDNGIMISRDKQLEETKQTPSLVPSDKQEQPSKQAMPQMPQVSDASCSSNKHRGALQVKQKAMQGGALKIQAPQISQASLASEVDQDQDFQVAIAQPVINFGGIKQVGYQVPSEDSSPMVAPDSFQKEAIQSKQFEPFLQNQEEDSELDSEDLAEQTVLDVSIDFSAEISDGEEQIDNLVVCKIENEFGYPEEYIIECLKNNRRNDATTCYYLFCKEDKHEVVNLLDDSPYNAAQKDFQ